MPGDCDGVFTNTNILRIPGTNGAYASATSYTSDIYAGYLMRRQGDGNPYAFQNVSSSSSGNGWAFSFIYRSMSCWQISITQG